MIAEKNIVTPDYLSLTTLQIKVGFTETDRIFSTASGFIYLFKDKNYLITNWHNLTGRNPLDGEPLSKKHAGIPNIILTYIKTKDGNGQALLEKIQLYDDAEMTSPRWFVHPTHKEKVDVVAIELNENQELIYSPINKEDFDENTPPEVGDDCFVIGYPFEDFRYLGLPIWKRASIATEPTINENQLPKLFIDTATRPGLSGSPVIYQRIGIHNMKDGVLSDDTLIGRIRGFLGVYSGRIGNDELQAQLGIVWKKKVIEEIITGQTRGNTEFQNRR